MFRECQKYPQVIWYPNSTKVNAKPNNGYLRIACILVELVVIDHSDVRRTTFKKALKAHLRHNDHISLK